MTWEKLILKYERGDKKKKSEYEINTRDGVCTWYLTTVYKMFRHREINNTENENRAGLPRMFQCKPSESSQSIFNQKAIDLAWDG